MSIKVESYLSCLPDGQLGFEVLHSWHTGQVASGLNVVLLGLSVNGDVGHSIGKVFEVVHSWHTGHVASGSNVVVMVLGLPVINEDVEPSVWKGQVGHSVGHWVGNVGQSEEGVISELWQLVVVGHSGQSVTVEEHSVPEELPSVEIVAQSVMVGHVGQLVAGSNVGQLVTVDGHAVVGSNVGHVIGKSVVCPGVVVTSAAGNCTTNTTVARLSKLSVWCAFFHIVKF